VTPELTARVETDKTASPTPGTPAVRIDFASVFRDHLLVYGWILGLFTEVARAEVRHGEVVIDLMSLAIPVPRPDVTQHFAASVHPEDDNHGFCLLVALPDAAVRPSYLRLAVSLHSGETVERVWPLGFGDAPVVAFFEKNRATLYWLLQHLPPPEAGRLRELSAPADAAPAPSRAALALQLQFGVDHCSVLDECILIVSGWVNERDRPLAAAQVRVGGATLDLLGNMAFGARSGSDTAPTPTVRGEAVPRLGFTVVARLPADWSQGSSGGSFAGHARAPEAVFDVSAANRHMRVRRALAAGNAARDELVALWRRTDADAAIGLIERIAALLGGAADAPALDWLGAEHSAAVERLPPSLSNTAPQYLLHFDGVVPIAAQGLYLTGWFRANPGSITRVACHGGFQSSRIDEHWARQPRPDVTAHLATLGLTGADQDHGFVCFVPLDATRGPGFVSVTTTAGEERRARLPRAVPGGALESVRAVLGSFSLGHRALRSLLDQHVGPAVRTAWAHRHRPAQPVTLQRFGTVPRAPRVSIIVPLYGRFDLAEIQLALFADDPDFQALELIYFVDDPSIYDAFRAQCEDLYEIYRVPFTLAFGGENFGFAGANNRAASVAAGKSLLLLNSDVFPKRPGWVAELVKIHDTLKKPGLLGAKLLYEDGSVQHAGMAFRRHAPWGDLWLNEHVQKGQSAVGLTGLRRAAAVTAACVLVDAELYRSLGGLSEDYIIGDFEDSDLSLRAEAAGRDNWVALDVELYHLERQSQDRIGGPNWRSNLTLYNCWQHHQQWAAHIETRTA
jgi:GT2 family glycosyltransferase